MRTQNKNIARTYSELKTLETYEERFEYLMLNGHVGHDTFGFDRHLNQKFYKSAEWRSVRNKVIMRDNACDLGMDDRDIYGTIFVHHMNPIEVDDIEEASEYLFNEDYLICVTFDTHNAIHFGDASYLQRDKFATRRHNDQSPWKK